MIFDYILNNRFYAPEDAVGEDQPATIILLSNKGGSTTPVGSSISITDLGNAVPLYEGNTYQITGSGKAGITGNAICSFSIDTELTYSSGIEIPHTETGQVLGNAPSFKITMHGTDSPYIQFKWGNSNEYTVYDFELTVVGYIHQEGSSGDDPEPTPTSDPVPTPTPDPEPTPVIPTTDPFISVPRTRLAKFLAMIAGNADVEPIMPKTRLEYWLNEIAAAKGGNPWKDTAGGLEAKLVTAQFTAVNIFPLYMLDLDLGIDELPYAINKMWFTVDGNHYRIAQVTADQINTEPMPQIAENTYGVTSSFLLRPADSEKSTELSNMPGIFVGGINACLYQLAGETIHAQMLFALMESDGEFNGDPNLLYTNADSVIINASFDHVEEGEKS